ncbi:AAA family ATPase [Vibrio cholerae]|nr:AAA family ATPase [Vibrio cholerae]
MKKASDWQLKIPYFIKRIEVEGLLSRKNIIWDLEDVNVLVGHNGSGKSTILELVRSALLGPDYFDYNGNIFNKFEHVKILLNNGSVIEATVANKFEHEIDMLEIVRKMLQKKILLINLKGKS